MLSYLSQISFSEKCSNSLFPHRLLPEGRHLFQKHFVYILLNPTDYLNIKMAHLLNLASLFLEKSTDFVCV